MGSSSAADRASRNARVRFGAGKAIPKASEVSDIPANAATRERFQATPTFGEQLSHNIKTQPLLLAAPFALFAKTAADTAGLIRSPSTAKRTSKGDGATRKAAMLATAVPVLPPVSLAAEAQAPASAVNPLLLQAKTGAANPSRKKKTLPPFGGLALKTALGA